MSWLQRQKLLVQQQSKVFRKRANGKDKLTNLLFCNFLLFKNSCCWRYVCVSAAYNHLTSDMRRCTGLASVQCTLFPTKLIYSKYLSYFVRLRLELSSPLLWSHRCGRRLTWNLYGKSLTSNSINMTPTWSFCYSLVSPLMLNTQPVMIVKQPSAI